MPYVPQIVLPLVEPCGKLISADPLHQLNRDESAAWHAMRDDERGLGGSSFYAFHPNGSSVDFFRVMSTRRQVRAWRNELRLTEFFQTARAFSAASIFSGYAVESLHSNKTAGYK